MTIQWAEDAVRQLTATHAYVAADNPGAADRLLLQITQAVKFLGSHSSAGREGRVANTRELVIANTPYIVAYRIENKNMVQILAVLHGKRRWPESF
jgi:addiction module RelE/StbE family toxin